MLARIKSHVFPLTWRKTVILTVAALVPGGLILSAMLAKAWKE